MVEYEQYKLTLNAMEQDIDELGKALNISSALSEAEALEKETASADFYSDMEKSSRVLKKLKQVKAKIEHFNSMGSEREDLLTMIEIAEEEEDLSYLDDVKKGIDTLKENIENTKLEALLSGPYDKNDAIITLHAGAGGTEAQDWCAMLLRMYQMWAEKRGYGVKTIDYLDGDEAGIKSVTILVEGLNAYGYAKCEKGVHRLVRISPFDAAGRRHTSFASVEVMPDIDETVEVNIRSEDLKVDTYRSSGAGGQHINKTSSAVRITHLPTGIVVSCQNERSQFQNKDMCMKMLKAKLAEIAEAEKKEKIEDIKGVQKEIAWGSQIRSYVFHPYTMVKDHRTGYEVGNINAVMDGELGGFINEYLRYMSTQNNN